ncbi:MAG: prepilin peptidase [Candidatus Dormibacteraeota bacterium]|nr:prepilin peptidase [Candidatus Dormibacteraeota bacterium]
MLAGFAILIALAGAALGSFAGVVASRGWRASLRGRSRCEHCGRTLQWFEVVPLLSYPLLRGRCRTCHARIRLGVFAWEAGGAVVALAAGLPLLVVLLPAQPAG